MLKHMKIKTSLIMGFGITIAAALIVVIAALILMNLQGSAYQEIMNTSVAANEQLADCRLNTNIVARDIRDMALGGDAVKGREDVNARLDTLSAGLAELQQLDPLGNGMVEEYIAAVTDWQTQIPGIVDMIAAGDLDEAAALIRTECTPRLNAVDTSAQAIAGELKAVEESAIAQESATLLVVEITVIVVMVLVSIGILVMIFRIIKGIVVPVGEVHDALNGFSEGRLDLPVSFEGQNELGEMCNALRTSQTVLSGVIGDICYLLGEMAQGNFDVRSHNTGLYVGSLSDVLESIRTINRTLSDALTQITQSADQVASGSDQVAAGAQSLAQGTTEQASSVQELSATLEEISMNSKDNAKNSALAMEHSQAAGQQVAESTRYMQEMVAAMDKISDSSKQIGNIISTIEDIAFQTNILALNAAVEAARAGSAGKGFAVVANEVRNLASKSDEAAKATKTLIEHSVTSVEEGNTIVHEVVKALEKTRELAEQAMGDMKQVAIAADKEAESIAQISQGIDQIASVVQTNSATSEQSAAASEELSGQAAVMKKLMVKFHLRGDSGTSYGAPSGGLSYTEDDSMGDGTFSSIGSSKY